MNCPRCKGEMRVKSGEAILDDGKIPCPHCEGEGTVEELKECVD